jgi:hypothetical protein
MTAYKHAYFDPEEMAALIAAVTAERAPDFNIGCYFNDRRVAYRDVTGGPMPQSSQISASLARTTFEWVRFQHNPVDRMFIHIDDVPETIRITLDIDTHFVSPADAETLLRGIETVALEAARDLTTPTRVAPMMADAR